MGLAAQIRASSETMRPKFGIALSVIRPAAEPASDPRFVARAFRPSLETRGARTRREIEAALAKGRRLDRDVGRHGLRHPPRASILEP